MLAASTEIAEIIGKGIQGKKLPDEIASIAYNNIWNKNIRRQRDFQAFGGDFLMAQPVNLLRGFFMAFFAVEQPVWSGFLAGYPGLPNNENHEDWNKRFSFALKLFFQMPTQVKLTMIIFAIKHTFEFGPTTLLRSLSPDFIFGSVSDDPVWELPSSTIGAVEAKDEARKMMNKFTEEKAKKQNNSDEPFSYPAPFE